MNIQIFGTTKCFDTKKAQRFFKERNIAFQMIDLKEKQLSKREYLSVKQSVKGLENLLDINCKDQTTLALIKHMSGEDQDDKVLENQQVLKTPIVRNGTKATVGFCPKIWEDWMKE